MKTRFVLTAVLATVAAAPLGAQCASAPIQARQACHAAEDLINYMTPQLGTAIAGGNSTLGQNAIHGGLGHFALSLRGTGIINGAFPDIGEKGFTTDGSKQTYNVKDQIIPGAGVDASIGIWKGWSLGATHIGGIDALVSALYVPDVEGDGDVSLKATDGNLKLGYGVRIGVLDESVVWPGVSFSYLQRDLPSITLSGSSEVGSGVGTAPGDFALNDFAVQTSAWRIVAGKSFLIFGLQAGFGQDTYKSTAGIRATVDTPLGPQTATGSAAIDMKRTNMFAGLSFNLFLFKAVVEAGQVSGGTFPASFNNFSKPASGSRQYASAGLRLAF
jgi:hypothetical protein